MPEGRLGFDRRFADSVLMYRVRPGTKIPLGRDDNFTSKFLKKMKQDSALRNRDTEVNIRTVDLTPEDMESGPLGMPIDKAGVIEVEFTNPPELTRDELEDLKDAMSQRLTQTFRELNYDQELIYTGGELVAKVNGPIGGPRPFVDTEIVIEALYDLDFTAPQMLDAIEKLELEKSLEGHISSQVRGITRVDVVVKNNRVLINTRSNELEVKTVPELKAILRDIERRTSVPIAADLTTITFIADGAEV